MKEGYDVFIKNKRIKKSQYLCMAFMFNLGN